MEASGQVWSRKAKSLLVVRNDETFLDLIVRQVLATRKQTGANLRFC